MFSHNPKTNRSPPSRGLVPRSFVRDATASVAVEFALLAPAFFGAVFAALLVAYAEFASAQLDAASKVAARAAMLGQATTTAQLKTSICGTIGGIIDCNQVMINIAPASSLANIDATSPTLSYNTDGSVSNTWKSNFGAPGSIMVMQLVYQLPVVAAPLFSFSSQSNGSRLLVSTQVFVAE